VLVVSTHLVTVTGMAKRSWVTVIIFWSFEDRERFEAMATEMAAASRAEPGTLMYDWYVNEDGTSGVLLEQYASQKALGDHVAGPVFTKIAPRYRGVARAQKVEMFGADGMERADVLKATTTWCGEPVAAVTD
jgi:quinol monooxygenase YgiN